jgi:DNA-binding MarR family transcriptional regulator
MKPDSTRSPAKVAARGPEPHKRALDLLNSAANKTSRGASRELIRAFGIGLVEWRILRLLGPHGTSTANLIGADLDLDKAAISRSLATLERLGWISRVPHPKDGRTRPLGLTPSGVDLYWRVAPVAQARERELFEGFTAEDISALSRLLERLYDNAARTAAREDDSRPLD